MGPSLYPSERRVAEAIAGDLAWAVECTAQEIADRTEVSRATVTRTAQTLGYGGYPQLRVALARELAFDRGSEATDSTAMGELVKAAERFAQLIPQVVHTLSEEQVEAAAQDIAAARRLLCVGNGLSHPLSIEASLRLTSVGRPAEQVGDPLGQQVSAHQLGEDSVCLALSASGSNPLTLAACRAALRSGAKVIAITSFSSSALAEIATMNLVVPSTDGTFRGEIELTSRVTHAFVIEVLTGIVKKRLGTHGAKARGAVYSMLEANLME